MFASAHGFPKFVKVGAAMEHELRKVGTSAAKRIIFIGPVSIDTVTQPISRRCSS
jgi:hypothetical protein